MFPSPTAEPIIAKINDRLLPHSFLSAIIFISHYDFIILYFIKNTIKDLLI
jgi:hypothetical protein